MKLLDAEGDEHMSHRLISENKIVHMFVHRVMYGYRVRAGFVADDWGVILDWCGGGDWKNVERLYSLTKAILLKRPEDRSCFKGLPTFSKVKPFHLDEEFVRIVGREAGEFELISLVQPEVPEWITKFLNL